MSSTTCQACERGSLIRLQCRKCHSMVGSCCLSFWCRQCNADYCRCCAPQVCACADWDNCKLKYCEACAQTLTQRCVLCKRLDCGITCCSRCGEALRCQECVVEELSGLSENRGEKRRCMLCGWTFCSECAVRSDAWLVVCVDCLKQFNRIRKRFKYS